MTREIRPVIENLVIALFDLGGALLVVAIGTPDRFTYTVVPWLMFGLAALHVGLAVGHWRRGY